MQKYIFVALICEGRGIQDTREGLFPRISIVYQVASELFCCCLNPKTF